MNRNRLKHRRAIDEGESYYVSMTDMMVGVLFVFIIILSFFALQYRSTTASLTEAKDSQTTALLQVATALQPLNARLEIDRTHHVVCLPSRILADEDGKRCFAYSGEPLATPAGAAAAASAADARAAVVDFVRTDLSAVQVAAQADNKNGILAFSADQLFEPNSATLSAGGRQIAARVGESLAARLPCYGYGAPAPAGCSGGKMAVVYVVSQAGFDAFSGAGRAAAALALQRSVVFHQALTAAQPVLGRLTNAPPGSSGAQPLLRVSTYGQSMVGAAPQGAPQTISIQFVPAGS